MSQPCTAAKIAVTSYDHNQATETALAETSLVAIEEDLIDPGKTYVFADGSRLCIVGTNVSFQLP